MKELKEIVYSIFMGIATLIFVGLGVAYFGRFILALILNP